MRIRAFFMQRSMSAPMFWRRSSGVVTQIFFAALLLIFANGICKAQLLEGDSPFLPAAVRVVSTVPPNGDVNPYGVAFVPGNFQSGSGPLRRSDILVSNYNNVLNLQGTGTTIVRCPVSGTPSVFFQGTAPLGLSTALGTLQAGFVVVGNSPTADGTSATATAGSLLVINNQGTLVQTFSNSYIQGPWDMALVDYGDAAVAYITNALNGTVSRLNFTVSSNGLTLQSWATIASGYVYRGDPVTLFVAPTGLVYDPQHDVLYIASTGDNAVFAISNASTRESSAGTGTLVYQDEVHLHGALALALAPNGHLLVTNNDGINPNPNFPSEIVEFTKEGSFVKQISVDPNGGGAFGLAVWANSSQHYFAAVDDNTSSLIIWTLTQ